MAICLCYNGYARKKRGAERLEFWRCDVAVVVDALGEVRRRFTVWAREYVDIPPRFMSGTAVRGDVVDEIVRLLVEEIVFTVAEIKIIAARRGFLGAISPDVIKE